MFSVTAIFIASVALVSLPKAALGQCANWTFGSTTITETCGSVGIYTPTPQSRLEVNGSLNITGDTKPSSGNSLNLGYDSTNNVGYIQTATYGVANRRLNLGGGSISFATIGAGNVSDGTSNVRMVIDGSGNAGIGTPTPAAPLHVLGNAGREVARFQGATDISNNRNFISIYTTNPGFWWELSNQDPSGGGSLNGLAFRERSGGDPSVPRVYLATGGNVGIGTTSPAHLLQVAGTIGATEIIVSSTGADYVLQPGYRLRSLNDVEVYIKANHHLPEIPSEKEMKETGIGLGEMQTKLLAKIEELTLHVIDEHERNDRLEQQNRHLEQRNDRLEQQNRDLEDRLTKLEKRVQ